MTYNIIVKIGGFDISASVQRIQITVDGPVGIWQVYCDNAGAVSTQSQIQPGAPVEISVDGHTMMKGYLENNKPHVSDPTAVFDNQVIFEGKNAAIDLLRLIVNAKFINARIGDVFDKPLRLAKSRIVANPTLVTNGNEIVKALEAKDSPLLDLFNEACKQLNYGYTVNWINDPPQLFAWPFNNTLDYGITLKSLTEPNDAQNNVLLCKRETLGDSVCNIVTVKGGYVLDNLTEKSANRWTSPDCTVSDDTSVQRIGNASIKAVCSTEPQATRRHLQLKFPVFFYDTLNYSEVASDKCSIHIMHNVKTFGSFSNYLNFYIRIKDTNGEVLSWHLADEKTTPDKWHEFQFEMGTLAQITNTKDGIVHRKNMWFNETGGTFNWNIVEFSIEPLIHAANYSPINSIATFWIDGLTFPSITPCETVEDQTSLNKYGRSMVTLYRPDLHTQEELYTVAMQELAVRKDPFEKFTFTTKFLYQLLYTGLCLNAQVPGLGIGNDSTSVKLRVTKFVHTIYPGEDLCKGEDAITEVEAVLFNAPITASRLLQSSNRQGAVNVSTESRLATLENESKGAAGATLINNVAGGGGFDGTVDGALKVLDEYLDLYYYENDKNSLPADSKRVTVTEWLFGNEMGIPMPPGADWQQPMGLMLNDRREETPGGLWHNSVHGVVIRGNTNPTTGSPGVGVSKHFFIRGDMVCRGPLNTHEGVITMYGNGRNAIPGNWRSGYRIGWGPTWQRKGTSFIYLAEGGHGAPRAHFNTNGSFSHYTFPYNDAETSATYKEASTIVVAVPKNSSTGESGLSAWYGYGNIEARDVISHGNFIGAHLYTGNPLSQAQNTIYVHSHLAPYDLSQGTTQAQTLVNLGSETYKWENLYVRNIRDKNNSTGAPNQVLTRASDGVGLEWRPQSTSNIKYGSGSGTTNTNGELTINISSLGFTSTPSITCTSVQTSGQHRVINFIITAQSATSFTVRAIALTASHRHITGGLDATQSLPLGTHTHPHGVTQAYDNNAVTGSSGGHTHYYSNWYPDTGNGRTGTPNQALANLTCTVWLRRLDNPANPQTSAINAVSAGGTMVATSHGAFTLCTEDFTPDIVYVQNTSFNWIAIGA